MGRNLWTFTGTTLKNICCNAAVVNTSLLEQMYQPPYSIIIDKSIYLHVEYIRQLIGRFFRVNDGHYKQPSLKKRKRGTFSVNASGILPGTQRPHDE